MRLKPKLLLVSAVLMLVSCTKTPEKTLIGEWKGTDLNGQTLSLVFNSDRTVGMVEGNVVVDGPTIGGKAEWRVDASRDPMELDIVVTRSSGELHVVLMIIRFITDQKLQVRTSEDKKQRPAGFSAEDSAYQVVLVKQ